MHRENVPHVWNRALALGAILALGLALRLWGIGGESLWFDEVCSVQFSDGTVRDVLYDSARDVHPPLYFLGLHFWRGLVGNSDGALRSLSAVWSLLGVFAVFLLGRDIGGRRAGLIAALLTAVNAYSIYYGQEARMYAQTAALGTLGTWCLWRWIAAEEEEPGAERWWRWPVGFGLCAAATLCSHYMGAMVILAQGIFAAVWFARRTRRWSIAVLGLVTVVVSGVFVPWMLYVIHLRGEMYVTALGWIPSPPLQDLVAFLVCEFFWGRAWNEAAVVLGHWSVPAALSSVAVIGVGGALLRGKRRGGGSPADGPPEHPQTSLGVARGATDRTLPAGGKGLAYLVWMLFGPVLLAMFYSFTYHPLYYRPRFCTFVLPPFLVLCGIAADRLRGRKAAWATAALAALMVAGTLTQHFTAQRTDMRRFAEIWRAEGDGAPIVFFPYYLDATASHYLATKIESASTEDLAGKDIWLCADPRRDFHSWESQKPDFDRLTNLGPVRRIATDTRLEILVVSVKNHESRR